MVMHAELAAAAVAILAAAAETLHAARCRRLARLAFGPARGPAVWARFAPVLRVAAFAALAWGLITLLELPPKVHVGPGHPRQRAPARPDRARRLAQHAPQGRRTQRRSEPDEARLAS